MSLGPRRPGWFQHLVYADQIALLEYRRWRLAGGESMDGLTPGSIRRMAGEALVQHAALIEHLSDGRLKVSRPASTDDAAMPSPLPTKPADMPFDHPDVLSGKYLL